jgi:hypothetical protein
MATVPITPAGGSNPPEIAHVDVELGSGTCIHSMMVMTLACDPVELLENPASRVSSKCRRL